MDSSPRGIWVDPGHSLHGERPICVIDSRGRRLLAGPMPPEKDEQEYAAALQAFLDRVDPVTSGTTAALGPRFGRFRRRAAERRGLAAAIKIV